VKKCKYILLFIVIMILTGCGANNNTDLTCTKIYDDDSEQVFIYSFKDNKVHNIKMILNIPEREMVDEESYKSEFNKINDIDGCSGEFIKNEDNSYTTTQNCDLNKMSDSSIKNLFLIDRKELEIKREKVIDNYSSDEQMTCK
jgi:hypothetical protein